MVLALEAAGALGESTSALTGYVLACVDNSVRAAGFRFGRAHARDAGLCVDDGPSGERSLKSQFKTADKVNARVGDRARSRRGSPKVLRRSANCDSYDAHRPLSMASDLETGRYCCGEGPVLLSQFVGQRVGGASSAHNIGYKVVLLA